VRYAVGFITAILLLTLLAVFFPDTILKATVSINDAAKRQGSINYLWVKVPTK
jgi:hypothetical protein